MENASFRCPAAPAIWTLRLLEKLGISPLYKWVYETAADRLLRGCRQGQRLLGWNPAFSNQDALVRNYIWYIENLASFEGSSGVSHRVPWSQGVLKLAKVLFSFP